MEHSDESKIWALGLTYLKQECKSGGSVICDETALKILELLDWLEIKTEEDFKKMCNLAARIFIITITSWQGGEDSDGDKNPEIDDYFRSIDIKSLVGSWVVGHHFVGKGIKNLFQLNDYFIQHWVKGVLLIKNFWQISLISMYIEICNLENPPKAIIEQIEDYFSKHSDKATRERFLRHLKEKIVN